MSNVYNKSPEAEALISELQRLTAWIGETSAAMVASGNAANRMSMANFATQLERANARIEEIQRELDEKHRFQ